MSAKSVYAPARMLDAATRKAITDLGISLDEYASNIESKLRARGEGALAESMYEQIDIWIENEKRIHAAAERQRHAPQPAPYRQNDGSLRRRS